MIVSATPKFYVPIPDKNWAKRFGEVSVIEAKEVCDGKGRVFLKILKSDSSIRKDLIISSRFFAECSGPVRILSESEYVALIDSLDSIPLSSSSEPLLTFVNRMFSMIKNRQLRY